MEHLRALIKPDPNIKQLRNRKMRSKELMSFPSAANICGGSHYVA